MSARVDLHRLDLAQAADRWYGGSGATESRGTFFGYAGRPSRGATALGTVLEGSADVTITRPWSVNGCVGRPTPIAYRRSISRHLPFRTGT